MDCLRILLLELLHITWLYTVVFVKMPIKKGLQLFERLNIDKDALSILGATFAQLLGLDKDRVINHIITHRWKKHVKQGITNLYE